MSNTSIEQPGELITLAHGNGGRWMRQLIEDVIAAPLANSLLDTNSDAVALADLDIPDDHELVMTSDGFTVNPLEFPGGDIGSLAIHGTVNDLAVAGAQPLYFSLNLIIEEGLSIETLKRIMASLACASQACGTKIICGDTKVVAKGEGSGLYLSMTGIGIKPKALSLKMSNIQDGDKIIVTGSVGDHGTAVLLARESFGLRGQLQSDSASLLPITSVIKTLPGVRFMRDPTRGGLATVAHEIAHSSGFNICLKESDIPVKKEVRSVCDILGYNPLYLACEGRAVIVVSQQEADTVLKVIHKTTASHEAIIIGEICLRRDADIPEVIMETEIGGQRLLSELESDPLPRIC